MENELFMGCFIAVLLICTIYLIWFVVTAVMVGVEYINTIGSYFDLSDQSSSPQAKLDYLEQYITAIEANDLTHGDACLFLPTRKTNLAENYKVLLSLRDRLRNLVANGTLNQMTYTMEIQQITNTEYCWFQHQLFEDRYFINHGLGLTHVFFCSEIYNHCSDD